MRSRFLAGLVAAVLVSAFPAVAGRIEGSALDVRSVENAVPAAFAESVRSVLAPRALVVSSDGSAWISIWSVDADGGSGSKAPPGEGRLLGGIHFERAWSDYKGTKVGAGDYTLRYWPLPEDGNHMGVAVWRDFLLLSRAASDPDAAPLDRESLFEHARDAAGKAHPAVLSVFPVPDGTDVGSLFENDLGQSTLAVEMGGIKMGLVLTGEGEH